MAKAPSTVKNDATFLAPVSTFVVEKNQMASNSDATFNVPPAAANCTVVIEKCPLNTAKGDSLLTEDDSIEILPRPPQKTLNKHQSKKELFE